MIITLLSADKKLASDAENRLQKLFTNAKSQQDSAYFSNALFVIHGKVVAAAIKVVFSLTKLRYKNARRKDLETGTHEVLEQATTECVKIYNEAYKPSEEIDVTGLLETLSKKAEFHAKSII